MKNRCKESATFFSIKLLFFVLFLFVIVNDIYSQMYTHFNRVADTNMDIVVEEPPKPSAPIQPARHYSRNEGRMLMRTMRFQWHYG